MLRMNCVRRLFLREDGSATLLVGLGATLLIGAAGIAIDMSRVQTAQSRLSSALDAAGLAAGNAVSSGNVDTITQKYFWANYPANYMGSTVNNPTVVPNADNSKLTLDVTGTVPTTFMKIFGKGAVPIKAHAEISRANLGLELVLVMDTTGSMDDGIGGGQTKIQAAKAAATSLINILYGSKTTLENVWIGMVPFAQAVNIGSSRAAWTSDPVNLPWYGWGTTSWNGCVDARETNSKDVSDDTPATMLFPKYYWPDDSNNDWVTTNWINPQTTTICSNKSSCTCANYGPCSCTVSANGQTQTCKSCSGSGSGKDCFQTVSTASNTYSYSSGKGPNRYCSNAITPLTSSKTTILNAITALNTDGNTHIVLGAGWAWRLLSPKWRDMWGGEMDVNDLPLDYDAPLMTKVVVLMTDGDNTISNSSRGAYWYLSDGKLGTTNSAAATTQLNTRTSQICTAMKAQGILVYTIAFGTDIGATAQTMLQNCASSADYYFYSPTSAALSTAFKQIGDSLANLHISQ